MATSNMEPNSIRSYASTAAALTVQKQSSRMTKKPEYISTVAAANPWKTLFKVRHGQLGQPMVALIALETQDLIDIVAYSQIQSAK